MATEKPKDEKKLSDAEKIAAIVEVLKANGMTLPKGLE